MAYDNSNSGMLARNERKQQPNHPDFTGQCEVGGVQYWISGWVKDGKPGSKMAGKRFFSLSFKPKDGQAATPASGQQASAAPARPSRGTPVAAAPAAKPPTGLKDREDEDVPF